MKGLAISDVAERTGLAAGTIRMWEQRYGFPQPERAASGYRIYSEADVDLLRRVTAFRERGLSIPAALERARAGGTGSDRPSIYGAIAASGEPMTVHTLTKRTLLGISRAIEDEALARAAGPFVAGAFQQVRNYQAAVHRYRRLAQVADAAVVFADFDAVRRPQDGPVEIPIAPDDALGNEWAVVVDAPGYAACLLAWERPRRDDGEPAPDFKRRFEAAWTLDPEVVRRASHVVCRLVARADSELAATYEELLSDRPLAIEAPAPALTAVTNRMLAYMDH
ncbi:MAG: MerR family transcriptional regulator [Actinomycetota bacterium]|nr:MerR family transcriptional regulator [Actinomycetota bacterium]